MIPTGGWALASLLAGDDPVGTATPFDQLFLLQIPQPWNRVALTSPPVPASIREPLREAAAAGITSYALLVDGDFPSPPEGLRLIHFARTQRALGPAYDREEFAVSREQLAPAMSRLIAGADPEQARELPDEVARDLLVCTHGERDGCCGEYGEQAFRYIRERYLRDDSGQRAVRVWRASHFGGHRFAPTMLDLPGGRCWGWLGEEATDRVIERKGQPGELRLHYRGCCALPSEVQCAERDLFFEHGWDWLGAGVKASVAASEEPAVAGQGLALVPRVGVGQDLKARLSFRLPGAKVQSRCALLSPAASSRVPASCGAEEREFILYTCSWEHARS